MSLRPRAAIRQYKRAQWGIKNLNRFSAVISPCTDAANRFLSAGLLAKTSHVLPYFCPTPLLEQPRLAPKNLQLTFLGRIRDYKGYDFFVDAVSRIPNVKGVLVGDFNPKSTDLVEALARRVGCLDRIECRAWCSRGELTQLMAETTVFVFPSIWPETLGIVGLEAMANGVPVVAFDVAGVREWLVPGKTGAMVPVKDTAAMVSAIASILADEELAARMGEAAIDRIRAKFLPSDHFDSLVQIYQTAKTGNS
jgi:glycosyltransferase involved in cell wall biosynthesis